MPRMSIGLNQVAPGDDIEEAVHRADSAMDAAKGQRRQSHEAGALVATAGAGATQPHRESFWWPGDHLGGCCWPCRGLLTAVLCMSDDRAV